MSHLDLATVQTWLDAYVAAWTSDDPAATAALFTTDAVYRGRPYLEGARGRDAIERYWAKHRDEPGTWRARLAPFLVHDDIAIISGEVDYDDELYSNLWVVRFGEDGLCADFTEWWMRRDSGASNQIR